MKAYHIVSTVLKLIADHARPGVATLTLNNLAEKKIRDLDGVPYNKGYIEPGHETRFPAAMCISVNHEIAHGIPGSYILKDGDLVNFDVSVLKDGECADAAFSMGIGDITPEDRKLLKTTKKALYAAIAIIKPGVKIREIANVIEDTARHKGLVVNRNLCGHGIGKAMHEEPWIYHAKNWYYNYPKAFQEYEKYMDIVLKEGQRICLEPMLTFKDRYGIKAADGWTWITRDRKNSAMFEHMMQITKDGCQVLTTHIEK
jgi:methionyl aminopeptidase